VLLKRKGQLHICETALAKTVAAEEQVEHIRAIENNSIFQKVWNSAKDILETQTTDECPVCLTPWEKTAVSSQHDALQHITDGLKSLADLTKAQSKQKNTYDQLTKATNDLISRLRNVETAAKKTFTRRHCRRCYKASGRDRKFAGDRKSTISAAREL
jgi:hypothetical protein